MKVLVATEKPFAAVAVEGIRKEIEGAGYTLDLLEKYTDKAQLLAAVADADALIVRSDKVDAEVLDAAGVEERTVDRTATVRFPYESMNDIMKIIKEEQPAVQDSLSLLREKLSQPVAAPVQLRQAKELVLVNLVEQLVADRLDAVFEKFNCCRCDKCRRDVAALALNTIPPQYVVAEPEEIPALLAAALIALVTTPVVRSLAFKMRAVDVPKDNRRMHNHPIPRMGGLAIFLGFLFSVLIFVPLTDELRGSAGAGHGAVLRGARVPGHV